MTRMSKTLFFLMLFSSAITLGQPTDASVKATRGLLDRLLPNYPYKNAFEFSWIPQDKGLDVFEIESCEEKVIIRGNNSVSMAMGLNWYLKYYCHCHVSWCGNQLKLPYPLPFVKEKVRRTAWARHRYFLNYCCFGYSLPWWDFGQWEKLTERYGTDHLYAADTFIEMTPPQGDEKYLGNLSQAIYHGMSRYATEPSGDSVTAAGRLWKKYQGSFKLDTVNLCTDKPVTCSHALPGHAARLANNGWSQNTDAYWASELRLIDET